MAPPTYGEAMRIGEVLKRARTRQGIDIRTVEDRTKIRTKYLRALEAEDWEILPSPAYAKGFLRTYAQLLDLDADAIVDEFRNQVEAKLDAGNPMRLSEPVLEGRRRLTDRGPRAPGPGTLVAMGVVIAIVVLLVIGLLGGDGSDEPERRPEARGKQEGSQGGQRGSGAGQGAGRRGAPGVLRLVIESSTQVCLLSGSGEVLIDGQVLSAGTEEQFERDRFELGFPMGYARSQFGLTLDGRRVRLPESASRAAFAIEPGSRPRELEAPGKACP